MAGLSLLLACGSAVFAASAEERAAEQQLSDAMKVQSESTLRYMQHVVTLANPWMEGRGPGTEGIDHAAAYIEWTFERLGLEPGFTGETVDFEATEYEEGDDELVSYRQPFYVRGQREVTRSDFMVRMGGAKESFEDGKDFVALGFTGELDRSDRAPIAFVGYGIEEGPDGYTSFAGDADLEGKVVVMLRFEPMTEEGKSIWADGAPGAGWSPRAGLFGKFRSVVERGAVGVIFVNPPGADDPRAGTMERPGGMAMNVGLEGPGIMMSPEAADRMIRMLDEEGRGLEDLKKIADSGAHGVIDLNKRRATAEMAVEIEDGRVLTENVGAILRGSGDLADEFVVVGGHYDHVGFGFFGSRGNVDGTSARGVLHPGADDNGSGTAGVLLMAEQVSKMYAEMGDTPRRSVFFQLYSAEEMGLLGARHFNRTTSLEPEDVVGMLNFDMIGRLTDDRLEVSGVASAAGWVTVVKEANEDFGFDLDLQGPHGGRSDHATFISAGIPAIHFFTGLHEQYHRPQDTTALLNFGGGARVAALGTKVVERLATEAEPIGPAAGSSSDERRERRRRAEGQSPAAAPAEAGAEAPAAPPAVEDEPQTGRMASMRVRFGIAPGNYGEEGEGVEVGEVMDGTPAQRSGLKTGDVIVSWNGDAVTDVRQWFEMLLKHEPGDKVDLIVVRDGSRVKLRAVLVASSTAE